MASSIGDPPLSFLFLSFLTVPMHVRCAFNVSLLNNLFPREYSTETPPLHDGIPVQLFISMVILDVGGINEAEMSFDLHCYLYERWQDKRLQISSGLEPHGTVLPSKIRSRLWHPSLAFDNALQTETLGRDATATLLLNDKYLLRVTKYNLKVRCNIDLSIFPLDTQRCAFYIRSITESNAVVRLFWSEEAWEEATLSHTSISLLRDPSDGRFQVEFPDPSSFNTTIYGGNFTVLYAPFVFRREITSRVLKTYLPSSLVVMLTWTSFWIDLAAFPARMTLGITSVLTLTTQIGKSDDFTNLNALDVWLFMCEVLVCASVLELVTAYTIARLRIQKIQQEHLRRAADRAGYHERLPQIVRVPLPIFMYEVPECPEETGMQTQTESVVKGPAKDRSSRGAVTIVEGVEEGGDADWPLWDYKEMLESQMEQAKSIDQLIGHLKMSRKMKDPRTTVDVISRVLFPCLFLIFAIWYWAVLLYITIIDYNKDMSHYFETMT